MSFEVQLFSQHKPADSLRKIIEETPAKDRIDKYGSVLRNLWFNDPNLALALANEAIQFAENSNDIRLRSIAYRLHSGCLYFLGEYDQGIASGKEALKLAVEANDSSLIALAHNNIGITYTKTGNYSASLKHLLTARYILLNIKQEFGLSNILNNLGLMYVKLQDYKRAREYLIEAVKVADRMKVYPTKQEAMNNLGLSYLYDGDLVEAESYFNESLITSVKAKSLSLDAKAYAGRGQVYLQRSQFSKAKLDFDCALKLYKKVGDNSGMSEAYNLIAKIYLKKNVLDSVFRLIKLSNTFAVAAASRERRLDNYKFLEDLYTQRKKYDSALYYKTKSVQLHDSLFNESMARTLANAELEVLQNEANAKLAVKDVTIKKALTQNYLLLGAIAVSLMFIVIFYLLVLKLRKTNFKLKEKTQRLIELNEEKNKLISIVSHDLRSPLNQIKGLTSILKMPTFILGDEANQLVSRISDSAGRLSQMISRILDVNAIEANKINIKIENVNLVELVKTVSMNFQITASEKNIQIFQELPGESIFVQIDRNYFIEVLENLLSNAIKFSPRERNIFVSIAKNHKVVKTIVKDEGPGIPNNEFDKLFLSYQKLSTRPTAGEESTGLGLSICKKYVEAMEGKISCESQTGIGTSFIVEFPLSHS